MNSKVLLCLMATAALMACTSDKTPTATNSSTISEVVFDMADAAFTTAGGALVAAQSSGASTSSFVCDDHGNPDGSVTTADKGAAYFYCKLTTNDHSPETVRGGYTLVKAILCAIEKQVSLTFPSTAREDLISFTKADPCFANVQDEDFDDFNSYVSQQSVATGDWDYKLVLSDTPNQADPSFYLHLKSSDNILAVKGTDKYSDTPSGWQGFSLSMDTVNGEVRYESWDPRFNRHIRLFIKGSLTAAGFVDVAGAHMAYADGGSIFTSGSWDGTNERYVLETDSGSGFAAVSGYPKCLGTCTGLMTLDNNAAFYDYSTNWSGGTLEQDKLKDSTSLLLDFTTIDTSKLVQ